MEIGEFLSARRKQLGLSYSQVGNSLNYTPQAIYRYEKGKVKIDISLVIPLCKVLDLSVASFFRMDLNDIQPYNPDETFSKENFAGALQYELSTNNVNTDEISKAINISSTRITKWSQGESLPSVDEFKALCKCLNISETNLFLGNTSQTDERQPLEPETPKDIKIPFYKRIPKSVLFIVPITAILIASGVGTGIAVSIKSSGNDDDIIANNDNSDNIDNDNNTFDTNDNSNGDTDMNRNTDSNYCEVIIKGYDLDSDEYLDSEWTYNIRQNSYMSIPSDIYYAHYCLKDYEYNNQKFDFKSTLITEDLVLKAIFEKDTYTVNFLDINGVAFNTQKVKYLSDAIKPEAPVVSNYKFIDYSGDYTKVEADVDIKSIYTCSDSVLKIDLNGGEIDNNNSDNYVIKNYSSDKFKTLPKPIKRGHTFKYYTSDDIEFKENTILKEVMNLKAIYTVNTYKMHLNHFNTDRYYAFGSEITDLPTKLNDGTVIKKWVYDNRYINEGDIYDFDCDITISPIIDDENNFVYTTNDDGTINLSRVLKCDSNVLDLTSINFKNIKKIEAGAVNSLDSVETLILNQSSVYIASKAFTDLVNLKEVYFNNVDSSSRFEPYIFSNCPNIKYLFAGNPLKDESTPLKLKEYGIVGSDDFTFKFNNKVTAMSPSYNEDFGTIGEFIVGDKLTKIDDSKLVTKGCKILKFTPSKSDGCTIDLSLPDVNQDEMTFYGTASANFKSLGHVKKLTFKNGKLNADNALRVDTLDMSASYYSFIYVKDVYADNVLLSDHVNPVNTVFHPAHDKLKVYFYGDTSLSDKYTSYEWLSDKDKTEIYYSAEKRYRDDEIVDIIL